MASYNMGLTNPLSSGLGPCWHKGPTMRAGGSINFTRNSERDTTIYFGGTVSSNIVSSGGYYGYPVTVVIEVDGRAVSSEFTVCNGGYGSAYISGSFYNDGRGTIQVYFYCNGGGSHNCTSSYGNFSKELVGSFPASYLPYNPEVPATNITGGAVYNQNGVQNGDDKLDWEFYVDWWGESAGTHSITQYNLDIYKSTDLNTIAVTVDRVQKWTRYNFERLLPKCKVRRNLLFLS